MRPLFVRPTAEGACSAARHPSFAFFFLCFTEFLLFLSSTFRGDAFCSQGSALLFRSRAMLVCVRGRSSWDGGNARFVLVPFVVFLSCSRERRRELKCNRNTAALHNAAFLFLSLRGISTP